MLHHCHAYDLLVVQQPDGSLSASQALVYFGHDMRSEIDFTMFELALVLVRDAQAFCHPFGADQRFDDATLCAVGTNLQPGRNAARMLLTDRTTTRDIRGLALMNVFLWRSQDPVAVVDVDGTITKNSLSGFWHTAVRQDFHARHCHAGVCPFVHAVASFSLSQPEQDDAATTTMNVLYLTNRPITYASETRDFLTSVRQQETNLPPGLLVGFIGTITGVLKMDFYSRNAHLFKMETIQKHVQSTYAPATPRFVIGLGNTATDMWCYHQVGVRRMYWIDHQSYIHALAAENDSVAAPDATTTTTPSDYEGRKEKVFPLGFQDPDLWSHALERRLEGDR